MWLYPRCSLFLYVARECEETCRVIPKRLAREKLASRSCISYRYYIFHTGPFSTSIPERILNSYYITLHNRSPSFRRIEPMMSRAQATERAISLISDQALRSRAFLERRFSFQKTDLRGCDRSRLSHPS